VLRLVARGARTRRSPRSWSSPSKRPRPTSLTFSPSSTSATGSRFWCAHTSPGSSRSAS